MKRSFCFVVSVGCRMIRALSMPDLYNKVNVILTEHCLIAIGVFFHILCPGIQSYGLCKP